MGKNTMMRKAIRGHLENNPALEKWVLPHSQFLNVICRSVLMQPAWCCIVVPPANRKLFPRYLCLSKPPDSQRRTVSDTSLTQNVWSADFSTLTAKYTFNRLVPHIKGNVGFVFTKEDLAEVRDLLVANKVIPDACTHWILNNTTKLVNSILKAFAVCFFLLKMGHSHKHFGYHVQDKLQYG